MAAWQACRAGACPEARQVLPLLRSLEGQDLCASSQKTGACSVRTSSGNQERHGQRKCRSGASVDDTRCSIPALHIGPQVPIEKISCNEIDSHLLFDHCLTRGKSPEPDGTSFQSVVSGRNQARDARYRLLWGPLRNTERLVVASCRKIGKTTRPRFPDRVIQQQARPPFYSARRPGTARRPGRCNTRRTGRLPPDLFFPVPFQALAWFHCTARPRVRFA